VFRTRWLALLGVLAVVALGFTLATARGAAQPANLPCLDSSVSFGLAQRVAASSGEAAFYVSVRALPGADCTVDGYPRVHIVSTGGSLVPVSVGGSPAMHSPRPVREIVTANQPVFFGIGWYTRTPGAKRSLCVGASSVRVSLGSGTGTVIPTRPAKICAAELKRASPRVFVSSMLHGSQFPAVALPS
jgi:hypothetical protein